MAWVPGRFDSSLRCRFRSFGINELEVASRIFGSWNQMEGWLRQVDGLRHAA